MKTSKTAYPSIAVPPSILKALTKDYHAAVDHEGEATNQMIDAKLRLFALQGCDKLRWCLRPNISTETRRNFLQHKRKWDSLFVHHKLFILHTADGHYWFARWAGGEQGWEPTSMRGPLVAIAPIVNASSDELTAVFDRPLKIR